MTALAITPLERETHAALPTNKPTFNKKDAEDILNPCGLGDYTTIDERGVWPKIERDLLMLEETELMRWRPARVFRNDPGAPRVDETPMLPFPFTARHLAAFMVNGVGRLVAERYGDLGDAAPDPDSLNAIDPDSEARTAVIQAFAAYHEAKKAVRNAPDEAPDTDALVRYLLAEPNTAPAQTATTQAVVPVDSSDGVEPVNAGPLSLTTGDIAFCFAGLRWKTEKEWKKPLGDKPKWLAACIVIPGVQGVSETRWSPVCIGAALVRGGHAKTNSVRAKFQTQSLLTPWLDEWKTYEADNLDTE